MLHCLRSKVNHFIFYALNILTISSRNVLRIGHFALNSCSFNLTTGIAAHFPWMFKADYTSLWIREADSDYVDYDDTS